MGENSGLLQDVEVKTDDVTVWVNSRGGCVARFGRYGVDIHKTVEEQMVSDQCLFCFHRATTVDDWKLFVEMVERFYKLKLPERCMPRRFRG